MACKFADKVGTLNWSLLAPWWILTHAHESFKEHHEGCAGSECRGFSHGFLLYKHTVRKRCRTASRRARQRSFNSTLLNPKPKTAQICRIYTVHLLTYSAPPTVCWSLPGYQTRNFPRPASGGWGLSVVWWWFRV